MHIHVGRLLKVAEACQQELKFIQSLLSSMSFFLKRKILYDKFQEREKNSISISFIQYTQYTLLVFAHSLHLFGLCCLSKKGEICILVSKLVAIRLKVWGREWEIWCEVSAGSMQQERNVAARVDFGPKWLKYTSLEHIQPVRSNVEQIIPFCQCSTYSTSKGL